VNSLHMLRRASEGLKYPSCFSLKSLYSRAGLAVGDVLDRMSGENAVIRIRLNSENIDVTENVSKKEDRRFRLDCDE